MPSAIAPRRGPAATTASTQPGPCAGQAEILAGAGRPREIDAPRQIGGGQLPHVAGVEVAVAEIGPVALGLAAIRKSPPVAASARAYTVQPGDTLSGIAANFGLDGW